MKVYPKYQEAKISNPCSEIYKLASGYIATNEPQGASVHKCNPADHCTRYDDFLTLGHEFVDGDAFLNSRGEVVIITNAQSNNRIIDGDDKRFILRAVALEEKPSEKVEWVNGDECEIEMQEGARRYLFGCECPNNQQTCIVFTKDGGGHMVMPIERLSKPETKQQHEDRQRLEAAYDLFVHVRHASNRDKWSFELFCNEKMNDYKSDYLAIVDKTNYRKEV